MERTWGSVGKLAAVRERGEVTVAQWKLEKSNWNYDREWVNFQSWSDSFDTEVVPEFLWNGVQVDFRKVRDSEVTYGEIS